MPPDMEAMAATVVQAFQTAIKPVLAKVETLTDKVIGLESRWSDLEALRAQIAAIETKELPIIAAEKGDKGDPGEMGLLGPAGPPGERGEQGEKGERGDPGPVGASGEKGADGLIGLPGRDGLNGRDGAIGPQGEPGINGGPGVNGLNGRDGKLEEIKLIKVGDRTWQWCFKNGDPIEGGTMHFDGLELYRGVWVEGKLYEPGDCSTLGGSEWHCSEPTMTKPGDMSKAWTLKVKRGRDGKDAAPITTTMPQVRLK